MKKSSLPTRANVVAVLDGPFGKKVIKTCNVITDEGDIFYAQKACDESPTHEFANLVLSKSTVAPTKASAYVTVTPISGTNKAPEASYPKTNDADADNTGAGQDVVTRRFYYAKADFNSTGILAGVITIHTPTSDSKVLTHFKFLSTAGADAPFDKTANDTLTIFHNTEFNGTV